MTKTINTDANQELRAAIYNFCCVMECHFSGNNTHNFPSRGEAETMAILTPNMLPKALDAYIASRGYPQIVPDTLNNLKLANFDTLDAVFVSLHPGQLDGDTASRNEIDAHPEKLRAWAELTRCMTEIWAKCAAREFAFLIKSTFLISESASFRVTVKHAKEGEKGSANLGNNQIEIFMAPGDTPEKIIGLTEYAVMASYFMHDEAIKAAVASGDKKEAAAMVMASQMMIEKINANLRPVHGASCFSHLPRNYSVDTRLPAPDPNKAVYINSAVSEHTEGGYQIIHSNQNGKSAGSNVVASLCRNSGSSDTDMITWLNRMSQALGVACETLALVSNTGLEGKQLVYANVTITEDKMYPQIRSIALDEVAVRLSLSSFKAAIYEALKLIEDQQQPEEGGGDDAGGDQPQPDPLQQIIDQLACGGQDGQGEGQEAEGQGQPSPGEGDQEAQGEASEGAGELTSEEREYRIAHGIGNEQARLIHQLLSLDREEEIVKAAAADWTDLAHHSLLRSMGFERQMTWRRPNRRFIGQDIYLPAFRRKKVNRVGILIDESGSIKIPNLEKFCGEVMRVMDILNPEGVDLFHFSTQVLQESLVQGEEWIAERKLNGGTNILRALEKVNENIENGVIYDAILCFTDLQDNSGGLKRAHGRRLIPDDIDFYWITDAPLQRDYTPNYGMLISMVDGSFVDYDGGERVPDAA